MMTCTKVILYKIVELLFIEKDDKKPIYMNMKKKLVCTV
jgi:hypothetical protein